MVNRKAFAVAAAVLAVAVVAVVGCDRSVAGTPSASSTIKTEQLPSRLGTYPPSPTTQPLPTTPEDIINQVQAFWNTNNVRLGRFSSEPVTGDISCGTQESHTADAAYCFDGNVLKYRTDKFADLMTSDTGDVAAEVILAHEYGHAIQDYADKLKPKNGGDRLINGVKAKELSADCFSGIYMSWSDAVKDPERLAPAVSLTPIAKSAPRIDAFQLGTTTRPEAAQKCLTEYEE